MFQTVNEYKLCNNNVVHLWVNFVLSLVEIYESESAHIHVCRWPEPVADLSLFFVGALYTYTSYIRIGPYINPSWPDQTSFAKSVTTKVT